MHCTCNIKIVTICVQTLRRRYMSQEIPDPQHALGTRVTQKTRNNWQVKIYSTATSTVTECELNQLVSLRLSSRECTKLPIFVAQMRDATTLKILVTEGRRNWSQYTVI
jgi:hypothetical protein